jgi:DNA-binding MarR family transcriptional regulator
MRKLVDKVNQSPSAPANEVFEAIHTIMHLYRSQQYRELRGEPVELTHMENRVLGFFARQPGATLSDLVSHSGRDKAQLTRLIRGLRDKGLLDATTDAADRRSTRLQLTARGKEIQQGLQEQGSRLADVALAGLGEAERAQLFALLGRVRSNLDRETKE